jgi:Uma2 family endonuclease
MALHAQRKYSFADYLVAERKADVRHEYVDGHVYDMVGATENHNIIVTNIVSELRFQMKARPCVVYASDMKVRIDAADAGKYPDVLAVCGERQFYDDQRDVLLNPSLIVEVLSKSTEAYDRGEKFAIYRRLLSLREYVLVAQDRCRVELFSRQIDDRWLLTEYSEKGDVIAIESIDCTLRLSEVYDKVVFDTPSARG